MHLRRKSWGDAGYAAEEFVAELGSASVCAALNLAPETLEENAACIASCRRDFRSEHITPHKRLSQLSLIGSCPETVPAAMPT
jgi:antirestriction protein ArdC